LGAAKNRKNAIFGWIVAGPEQSGIVNQDDMALTMTRDRVQLLFQGRFLIAARRARSRVMSIEPKERRLLNPREYLRQTGATVPLHDSNVLVGSKPLGRGVRERLVQFDRHDRPERVSAFPRHLSLERAGLDEDPQSMTPSGCENGLDLDGVGRGFSLARISRAGSIRSEICLVAPGDHGFTQGALEESG